MVNIREHGETLVVSMSGVFDFDASRDLLLKSKTFLKTHDLRKIEVHLDGVTACNSCAIGALILLADKAPGGFSVELNQCDSQVQKLFNSGFLDRYLTIHTPQHAQKFPCENCHDKGCQTPVKSCTHAHFLGKDVYPMVSHIL